MADEGSGYERLGEKRLKLVDVVAQSVGFIGPVFSAAFLIPLIAGFSASGKGAGIASPFAVLLAAVGTFALGWIVAQYAKRVHAAGSLYDYVSNGLGGRIGGVAGWLYYGGTTVLASAIACLVGWYLHDVIFTADPAVPGVISSTSPLPMWTWSLIFVAGVFLIQYLGVRLSTRVQLTLALVSAAVVLAFFVKVIVDVPVNSLKAFNPGEAPNLSSLLFGVLYGVLIFVGFETAANLAEETADPKRSIPRAVLLTVGIVTVFYLVAAYAQIAGFGFDLGTITDPAVAAAPLFALGSPPAVGGYGSDAILKLLEVVVLLDVLAVGLGAAVASTRGVFALARDRRIPGVLATVSSSRGTPIGAIMFVEAVSLVMVALSEFADTLFALTPRASHYFEMFVWLSTFGGFALMVVYGSLAIGGFRGLRDHPNYVGVVIAGIIGLAIAVGAVFGGIYRQPNPANLVWRYVLAWTVLGIIVTALAKGRAPASGVLSDLRSDQTQPAGG
ncbi:MAG: APC family permease [Actinomycetota bacterium]|nr:APC family permease [Actinomycetota bacterium]